MSILGDQILDTRYTSARPEKLFISIGGISCAIIGHDPYFFDLLRARYQWFQSSGPATYEILVRLLSSEEFTLEDVGQPLYPPINRVNSGNNYIIRQADNPFVAVVNTLSKKVLVKLSSSQYCFDSFLRMLFTLILADERGLLLHASAVSENGRGSVFFGPSGSGKTTVTQLSTGRTILTDELGIIRPYNGKYRVYGTPFWGDFMPYRCNVWAELTGLYSLKKDHRNSLVPLNKVQAVNYLYKCVPFFSNDNQLLGRIHDTCCALVDTVPVYELHFRPDTSFWQLVTEHS